MTRHDLTPSQLARMRAVLDRVQQQIDTVGWSIMATYFETSLGAVSLAYTVGLTEKDLPELCIVGIGPGNDRPILHDLATRVTGGSPLHHGQRLGDVVEGYDVLVAEGHATGDIQPSMALHRYGPAIRLQQVIWPDPDGRFPGEDCYSMPPVQQPVIADPAQPPPPTGHLLLTIDERRRFGPTDWANAAALIQTWGPDVTVSVNVQTRQLLLRGLRAVTPQQITALADRLVILPADISY